MTPQRAVRIEDLDKPFVPTDPIDRVLWCSVCGAVANRDFPFTGNPGASCCDKPMLMMRVVEDTR